MKVLAHAYFLKLFQSWKFICDNRLFLLHCMFIYIIGLLPNTQNCGLRMLWGCRERFPRHRLQRKPLVSDPGMHHGTCVTHVPWCMSGSLSRDDGENVPGIPGACATRNFAYLVRGPWWKEKTGLQIIRRHDVDFWQTKTLNNSTAPVTTACLCCVLK